MGLTTTESRVLALWDAGSATRHIVQATGIARPRVVEIVQTYHVHDDLTPHRRAMAKGCADLRAAIDAMLARRRPEPRALWNTRTLAEVDAQQGAVA